MISIADPDLREEERAAVDAVIDTGTLADGPNVRSFENAFAEFAGTAHAVATSNGTTALQTALEAIGIGDGDRVLTTSFSFIASANAIRLTGATPVFADIDPEMYTLDQTAAEEITRSTAIDAILVVHLYGLPADMDALVALADDLDVPVIEDCAQAHGATYRGQPVGSIGDVGCFSFYPTKNMTTGEGGMIVTDDSDIADFSTKYVNHGRSLSGGRSGYEHEIVGHNFRMTSIAAAIGQAQLERLPTYIERRRENAKRYSDGLADVAVDTPIEPADRVHSYHQYTIQSANRDGLAAHCRENDIGAGVYYPTCIHEQPAYADIDHTAPTAESIADRVLSLPVHPGVTPTEIETVIEVIDAYVE